MGTGTKDVEDHDLLKLESDVRSWFGYPGLKLGIRMWGLMGTSGLSGVEVRLLGMGAVR